jgi:hypothetical protein
MTQRAEYARILRQLIDGQQDELGELLTPIAEYLEGGESTWTCGCGIVNGVNLAVCRVCGRREGEL